ncbi:MAG TPA: 16S rRNA (cytosine(1402)-N(4))-methyltransferase RsmH [Candidatus Saccharimonadales bacterium]|nr:16S rRNA (cytosine(1402)-N(4))-methyltransferase RsmH [Candidatus Saccharimonadales bacterium]
MHQTKHQNQNKQHLPVLLDNVLDVLAPQSGETYLDLTAGYGGHAGAILERTGSLTTLVLVDRDENAITTLQDRFGKAADIRHQDFLSASRELAAEGQQFDLILADLGVSSPHLNEAHRGFAINQNGPLDMRMDQGQSLSAADIVNTYSVDKVAKVLREYGEEPKATAIAEAIVHHRPITTTEELAAVVAKLWPGHSRVHPATRTFQALRIAVNDELGQLQKSLPLWLKLLKPGGRLAVISFHSLEDRMVKQAFAAVSGDRYDADFRLLTKRPLTASPREIVLNPRARSAKLRAAVKIKTEREH